jgi:hypothetical protein
VSISFAILGQKLPQAQLVDEIVDIALGHDAIPHSRRLLFWAALIRAS